MSNDRGQHEALNRLGSAVRKSHTRRLAYLIAPRTDLAQSRRYFAAGYLSRPDSCPWYDTNRSNT